MKGKGELTLNFQTLVLPNGFTIAIYTSLRGAGGAGDRKGEATIQGDSSKGDDGKTYELRLGPVWFWKDHKYELKSNGAAEIKGELAKTENTLYLYPYTITQAGSTIELADKDGAPTWSRRGNGQGRS